MRVPVSATTGPEESDEALVALVAAGDRRAYGVLVDRHLDRTVAVARRILGTNAEAEDVAQEAFLRLWRNADRYRPEVGRFTTWFYRITTNLCLDLRRRPAHAALEEAGDPADPGDDPAQAAERSAAATALSRAMADLPERQRAAISLTYAAGMSNADAAATLSVSVKALETLLVRARRALRSGLADWGVTERGRGNGERAMPAGEGEGR